jgi:hypothetical protein
MTGKIPSGLYRFKQVSANWSCLAHNPYNFQERRAIMPKPQKEGLTGAYAFLLLCCYLNKINVALTHKKNSACLTEIT